ncbi:MAG: hypothetical protein RIK87_13190 [Fuerstiella sp.]
MSAATLRAGLASKLDSLRDELRSWQEIAEGRLDSQGKRQLHPQFPVFAKHQSQIMRLNSFFDGVVQSLEGSITTQDALTFSGARKIGDRILQGHALWAWYRDKLLLRYSPHLQRYLAAADEFAWRCFKPFREAHSAAGKGDETARVPPLIYLARQMSPYIYPRNWTLANQIPEVSDQVYATFLAKAPFSVVRLPFYQTTHLPETMVLAHEMGHVVEMDLDLTVALDEALAKIPDAEVPPERRRTWQRCRIEVFADLFGAAVGGVAFCRSLAAFLAKDRDALLEERIGDSARYAYPTAYLRVMLVLEVLRQRDGERIAAADSLLTEWQQACGTQHPYQEFEADISPVVNSLINTPIPQLQNACILKLGNYTKYDDEKAEKAATGMLARQQPDSRDPRVLFAAAALAFHQDPERYADSGVETLVLSRIEKYADRKPRSRDGISRQDLTTDRQAGQAVGALLG